MLFLPQKAQPSFFYFLLNLEKINTFNLPAQ